MSSLPLIRRREYEKPLFRCEISRNDIVISAQPESYVSTPRHVYTNDILVRWNESENKATWYNNSLHPVIIEDIVINRGDRITVSIVKIKDHQIMYTGTMILPIVTSYRTIVNATILSTDGHCIVFLENSIPCRINTITFTSIDSIVQQIQDEHFRAAIEQDIQSHTDLMNTSIKCLNEEINLATARAHIRYDTTIKRAQTKIEGLNQLINNHHTSSVSFL